MKTCSIKFVPSGRGKARCAPDPHYPKGKHIDISESRLSCSVELPYPAPECGHLLIRCELCSMYIAVTAAGRPDDPTSIVFPCKLAQGRLEVNQ